jgi:hypothetical protein
MNWNHVCEFTSLKNMVEQKFTSLQVKMPKRDEIQRNVRISLEIPPSNEPGQYKYLVVRQVRASSNYELTGGQGHIALTEIE